MRTLDRYLTRLFAKNFLIAAFSLTGLYAFQAFMGQLLDREFPIEQLVIYNLLDLPNVFVQMTPPSVLMATVFSFSLLSRTNELVACYSIGMGLKRIIGVVLSVVFVISCMTVVMQDRLLPPLFKRRMTYYHRVMKNEADYFLDVKQDKIWYRSQNLIYNLRTFDKNSNTIRGMSVYTFDGDFNLVQVVDAEQATHTDTGWKLSHGTVTTFKKDDPFPYTQNFEEKELQIAETPKDFQEVEKKVDALRFKELFRYIKRTQAAGADTKAYEVKFHSRLSISFIPLVMCLLGVPFSIRGRRESGGIARDVGVSLAVTFFYWLFYSIGLSLGTNGALLPWVAAWLPSTIFAILAVALISRLRN